MADPALTQVIAAMQQTLAAAMNRNVFTDRDESEPIQQHERPCVVIRVPEISLDERNEDGEASQLWACTVDLDLYEDEDSADNLTKQHAVSAAEAWGALAADRTLGNRVYELTPMSLTASADAIPAFGVAIVTLDMRFLTKFDDWTAIIF